MNRLKEEESPPLDYGDPGFWEALFFPLDEMLSVKYR